MKKESKILKVCAYLSLFDCYISFPAKLVQFFADTFPLLWNNLQHKMFEHKAIQGYVSILPITNINVLVQYLQPDIHVFLHVDDCLFLGDHIGNL